MTLYQDTELQWLYKVNKHQVSDLIFIDEEIMFLKNLLEKYFLNALADNHVNRAQLIGRQLAELSMIKANVTKDVLTQQGILHSKLNDLSDKSLEFVKLDNDKIEDELKDIHKCFKAIKKEIFSLYKHLSLRYAYNVEANQT